RERAQFARLSGSSIAGIDAAGWITDFLNAAYYRRSARSREVDDLRLASAIVTTHWHCVEPRRLRATDVLAFHRAFGRARLGGRAGSPRGILTRTDLLEGAADLFGDWFGEAYLDDERRGWGIVFASAHQKRGYRPERRLKLARLDELTPPAAAGAEQTWQTYPPVAVASAERVLDALTRTETWPDYASEIGRFTPLRAAPLEGQTFEIEVAAGTAAGRPVFQRGYVSVTRLVTAEDPVALEAYFDELEDGMARFGRDQPRVLPAGAQPLLGLDLTTHRGHFLGRAMNRLLLYTDEGRAYLRAAGTWDPMAWHLDQVFRRAGRDAQHAFWGEGGIERESMLHQLALRVAR
ncbi:MAG: hypothetical protein H0T43_06855, partial [Solirubrobacterales bacterium]|nr:hypothetical protein [Solirubrobacterales bacterium]